MRGRSLSSSATRIAARVGITSHSRAGKNQRQPRNSRKRKAAWGTPWSVAAIEEQPGRLGVNSESLATVVGVADRECLLKGRHGEIREAAQHDAARAIACLHLEPGAGDAAQVVRQFHCRRPRTLRGSGSDDDGKDGMAVFCQQQ